MAVTGGIGGIDRDGVRGLEDRDHLVDSAELFQQKVARLQFELETAPTNVEIMVNSNN